jgi:hypothetical protein
VTLVTRYSLASVLMKRHTKSPVLDISIRGDQLEHDRIQLEHNLQHTDLSLHLSSHDDDTVEYARHNSAPSAFPDFISFEHRSRDNYDADMHSQIHAWSYRTGDDEDGISPYGGETVSTAAHHASALTLSAGLGGRAGRREISLSGAEYDPDRPLHDMMAAVDPKLSMFDMDPSRSRYEVGWLIQSCSTPSNYCHSPHSTHYIAPASWIVSFNLATRHRLLAPAQCASAPHTPLLPPPPPPIQTVPVPASPTPSNVSPSPQNARVVHRYNTAPTIDMLKFLRLH